MLKTRIPNNIKQDCFIHAPKIISVKKFTEDSLSEFSKDFNEALLSGQDIIPIQIDSFGGQVYALSGMLSLIRESPVPVCTFTTTKAMSCGAILLAAGSPGMRFASKESYVLVHDLSAATGDKGLSIEAWADHIKECGASFFDRLDEMCRKPKGFFRKKLKESGNIDLYYTANEAQKEGLVDKVKTPIFEATIIQKFSIK